MIKYKAMRSNNMPVNYRKLFWPTVVLIAATSTALPLVSVKTKTATTSTPERNKPANTKLAEPPKSAERSLPKVMPRISAFPLIQGDLQNQTIEAEIITIHPAGFEPTAITRPKGLFILEVEDRSGLREVDVRLSAERGDRVFQVKAAREKADWNRLVDPPPGRYVLTEINHPDWACIITITAQ
jgi:hypothetical protein